MLHDKLRLKQNVEHSCVSFRIFKVLDKIYRSGCKGLTIGSATSPASYFHLDREREKERIVLDVYRTGNYSQIYTIITNPGKPGTGPNGKKYVFHATNSLVCSTRNGRK